MTQAEYIAQLEERCHELEAKIGRLQEGCRNLLAYFPQKGEAAPIRVDDTTADGGGKALGHGRPQP